MYEIDPRRDDLIEEFRRNPFGPHSPELDLLANRLRLMPMAERFVLVALRTGGPWHVARMPARGARIECLEGHGFEDYGDALREVFRLRFQAVTGVDPWGG